MITEKLTIDELNTIVEKCKQTIAKKHKMLPIKIRADFTGQCYAYRKVLPKRGTIVETETPNGEFMTKREFVLDNPTVEEIEWFDSKRIEYQAIYTGE